MTVQRISSHGKNTMLKTLPVLYCMTRQGWSQVTLIGCDARVTKISLKLPRVTVSLPLCAPFIVTHSTLVSLYWMLADTTLTTYLQESSAKLKNQRVSYAFTSIKCPSYFAYFLLPTSSIVRPPGTAVPDGLMFYPWCFFLFLFATLSPRSLDRSPWNFTTWSESARIL